MPVLRVIAGPDTGATAVVDRAPVTVGRGADCGLRIRDKHASCIHAVFEPVEGGHRVRDLESSSGTAVNGQRVLERRLLFGDVVTIGETVILFGSGDAAVDTQTVRGAEAPLPGGSEMR